MEDYEIAFLKYFTYSNVKFLSVIIYFIFKNENENEFSFSSTSNDDLVVNDVKRLIIVKTKFGETKIPNFTNEFFEKFSEIVKNQE